MEVAGQHGLTAAGSSKKFREVEKEYRKRKYIVMISGLGAIQQKLRSEYNTRNQQYREAEIVTKNGEIQSHIMRRTGVLDTCLK